MIIDPSICWPFLPLSIPEWLSPGIPLFFAEMHPRASHIPNSLPLASICFLLLLTGYPRIGILNKLGLLSRDSRGQNSKLFRRTLVSLKAQEKSMFLNFLVFSVASFGYMHPLVHGPNSLCLYLLWFMLRTCYYGVIHFDPEEISLVNALSMSEVVSVLFSACRSPFFWVGYICFAVIWGHFHFVGE